MNEIIIQYEKLKRNDIIFVDERTDTDTIA